LEFEVEDVFRHVAETINLLYPVHAAVHRTAHPASAHSVVRKEPTKSKKFFCQIKNKIKTGDDNFAMHMDAIAEGLFVVGL
jgi:hypothetical protein